jgi:hypothetical protein
VEVGERSARGGGSSQTSCARRVAGLLWLTTLLFDTTTVDAIVGATPDPVMHWEAYNYTHAEVSVVGDPLLRALTAPPDVRNVLPHTDVCRWCSPHVLKGSKPLSGLVWAAPHPLHASPDSSTTCTSTSVCATPKQRSWSSYRLK